MVIALEWLRMSGVDAEAIVPAPLAGVPAAFGVPARSYPHRDGAAAALAAITRHVDELRPDVVLVADLLLLAGYSADFGDGLFPVLERLRDRCPVVVWDLYDWETRAPVVDVCGQLRRARPLEVPPHVGRLLPSPYLPPAPSTAGRGRYAAIEGAPRTAHDRERARRELGVDEGTRLVLVTTSAWQHLRDDPDVAPVVDHFPPFALALLDQAARRCGNVALAHLGPEPFPAEGVAMPYRHFAPSPEVYHRLMAAADLMVTFNCIASSAIRAARSGIAVAALHVGRGILEADPSAGTTPAARAASRYRAAVASSRYPVSIWPVGMHAFAQSLLRDNPFVSLAEHLDVLHPDESVASLAALLTGPDGLRARQQRYFDDVDRQVDTPARALEHALRAGGG